ncbi:helix-turn-helix domain-containing protein [Actinoallomurus sp. NPDC052274]|uniref:helix-turn-helix domain-containing protein n=1 Tax=Actinoallomurus sp. NPDC052274 TaxID=3155420 RepID=UPI00341223BE
MTPSTGAAEDEGPAALLKTAEVARLFRVSRSTVTSWAYRGLIPYTKTPTGHLRFYRASIEQRLAERNASVAESPSPREQRR